MPGLLADWPISVSRAAAVHTAYLNKLVPAVKLRKGEPLKTANGTTTVADGGTVSANHDGWMWDLTIPGNDDHDFYIFATGESVGNVAVTG